MKYSKYLSFVCISDSTKILYNSLKENITYLRNSDMENLPDVETLHELYPDVYKILIDNGGIIEDDVDEVAFLRQKINEICYTKRKFILHINPTLDCNFNCWYCYENHIKDSKMGKPILESTLKAIDIISADPELEEFALSFFGGEPLLRFNDICVPIINHFIEKCNNRELRYSIQFTSNGSLLKDDCIAFLKDKNVSFQITLDGNRDAHNLVRFEKHGIGSFDLIIDNVRKLLHNSIDVILRFNYTKANLESIRDILPVINQFSESEKLHLTMDFQRVWQDDDKTDYTQISELLEEITEDFKENSITVKDNNIFDYISNPCYGDYNNYALINFNGDLFSCTARDFKKDKSTGVLTKDGALAWNDKKAERMTKKFTRSICHSCAIAPVCGGGCRQNHIDHPEDDYCIFGSGEEREAQIRDIIISRILTLYVDENQNT